MVIGLLRWGDLENRLMLLSAIIHPKIFLIGRNSLTYGYIQKTKMISGDSPCSKLVLFTFFIQQTPLQMAGTYDSTL